MIGLRRNKRGDMVLTIDSYIDIDSTPDIQPEYFDCIYINTKSERAFHAILYGASPILSWKCSYKPIFANTAVSGREQISDYLIDAYVSDMNNEKVYEIIDRIRLARQKYGIKSETTRTAQPNHLFSNILRYLLSRDQRVMGHRLLEKSSLGYINPIFEHYHSMGLFHLNEMFMFKDSMVEYGALKMHRYLIKEHLCPKCNHSHLLYTECCPKCGSSNLKIQNIIHHFACANVSPETSYNVGGMLVCPKCHRKLRHIGVDYDRPAVVYSCQDCENSFTSPVTKTTCCYCESTYPVSALVPRDVVDYEITEEGIRVLTTGSYAFSNLGNLYDNYMEYPLLENRLQRILMEANQKDEVTVMAGKIWVVNDNKDTVKLRDNIQSQLCRIFGNHKVSYRNNIFYVATSVYDKASVETTQKKLSREMSMAIRKIADKIEPEEIVCCMLDTKSRSLTEKNDDFFSRLTYVDMTPDDYCLYSETPIEVDEEVEAQAERLDLQPEEDDNDKILRRIKLYKQLVAILVIIAGVLIMVSILALTVLR